MKSKRKIWLGVGAFVVAGTSAASAAGPLMSEKIPGLRASSGLVTETAVPRPLSSGFRIAQHDNHGAKEGDAGEQGGEKGVASLPPDLAFAVRIALLRGHLLVGEELVKQQQWNAALPHFFHPTEEIYGDIKERLVEYKVPPFDTTLKTLADAVKVKKSGEVAKAQKAVNDALALVDAAMKERSGDWTGFVVETAIEALKAATGEYKEAIVDGRIAKPVEYQDARGFIWQAERMIESVAAESEKKDAEALSAVRAGIAELKKAFPTAMPPKVPVKDPSEVLGDVARIELAAGKLM
jgi:hypothetical protein